MERVVEKCRLDSTRQVDSLVTEKFMSFEEQISSVHAACKHEMTGFQQSLQALEAAKDDLNMSVNESIQETQELLRSAQAELQSVSKRLDEFDQRLQAHDERALADSVASLTALVEDIQRRMQMNAGQVDIAMQDIKALNEALEALRSRFDSSSEEVSRLSVSVGEGSEAVKQLAEHRLTNALSDTARDFRAHIAAVNASVEAHHKAFSEELTTIHERCDVGDQRVRELSDVIKHFEASHLTCIGNTQIAQRGHISAAPPASHGQSILSALPSSIDVAEVEGTPAHAPQIIERGSSSHPAEMKPSTAKEQKLDAATHLVESHPDAMEIDLNYQDIKAEARLQADVHGARRSSATTVSEGAKDASYFFDDVSADGSHSHSKQDSMEVDDAQTFERDANDTSAAEVFSERNDKADDAEHLDASQTVEAASREEHRHVIEHEVGCTKAEDIEGCSESVARDAQEVFGHNHSAFASVVMRVPAAAAAGRQAVNDVYRNADGSEAVETEGYDGVASKQPSESVGEKINDSSQVSCMFESGNRPLECFMSDAHADCVDLPKGQHDFVPQETLCGDLASTSVAEVTHRVSMLTVEGRVRSLEAETELIPAELASYFENAAACDTTLADSERIGIEYTKSGGNDQQVMEEGEGENQMDMMETEEAVDQEPEAVEIANRAPEEETKVSEPCASSFEASVKESPQITGESKEQLSQRERSENGDAETEQVQTSVMECAKNHVDENCSVDQLIPGASEVTVSNARTSFPAFESTDSSMPNCDLHRETKMLVEHVAKVDKNDNAATAHASHVATEAVRPCSDEFGLNERHEAKSTDEGSSLKPAKLEETPLSKELPEAHAINEIPSCLAAHCYGPVKEQGVEEAENECDAGTSCTTDVHEARNGYQEHVAESITGLPAARPPQTRTRKEENATMSPETVQNIVQEQQPEIVESDTQIDSVAEPHHDRLEAENAGVDPIISAEDAECVVGTQFQCAVEDNECSFNEAFVSYDSPSPSATPRPTRLSCPLVLQEVISPIRTCNSDHLDGSLETLDAWDDSLSTYAPGVTPTMQSHATEVSFASKKASEFVATAKPLALRMEASAKDDSMAALGFDSDDAVSPSNYDSASGTLDLPLVVSAKSSD
eukprot:TRINITY_DN20942_c0_g1_i1.p1 TRINITY_DN20942_c0_g1~~TRINITY_DN20942_c0_g1_i1.p1  ORF type:complete len:1305 (-),score=142.88 TRINITY_DN20942_c0_g1_i1:48-3437(-)